MALIPARCATEGGVSPRPHSQQKLASSGFSVPQSGQGSGAAAGGCENSNDGAGGLVLRLATARSSLPQSRQYRRCPGLPLPQRLHSTATGERAGRRESTPDRHGLFRLVCAIFAGSGETQDVRFRTHSVRARRPRGKRPSSHGGAVRWCPTDTERLRGSDVLQSVLSVCGVLPARHGSPQLHHEFDGGQTGEPEARDVVGAALAGTVRPGAQQKRSIHGCAAHEELWGQLELDSETEGPDEAPRFGSPFATIQGPTERRLDIGHEALSSIPVEASLRAELLQDRQDEQVGRVVTRELVGAPEVPREPRPIAGSDDHPAPSLQDARGLRVVRADRPGGGDRLRGEGPTVLKMIEPGRRGTEVRLRQRVRRDQKQDRRDFCLHCGPEPPLGALGGGACRDGEVVSQNVGWQGACSGPGGGTDSGWGALTGRASVPLSVERP